MSKQTVNFLELFKKKKYSLIISIIEKKLTENNNLNFWFIKFKRCL